MAVDPRIALGVQPIQIDNPLAQYGQVQNILAAQAQQRSAGTQNELANVQLGQARMTMQQAQEARDTVTKIMSEIGKHGGPADPMEAAMLMLKDHRPEVQATGGHLLDSAQKVLAYQQQSQFLKDQSPNALAGPTAASLSPITPETAFTAPVSRGTQTNTLASTASPAQQVNAMAAPQGKTAESIAAEINQKDKQYGTAPGWLKQRELMMLQYKEALDPRHATFAAINPKDYTQDSIAKFNQTKNYSDLVVKPDAKNTNLGNVSPADYTPDSVQKFAASGNYSDLVLKPSKVDKSVANINPDSYTPESVQKFTTSNNYADLVPKTSKEGKPIANINPDSYTPDSVQKFAASNNYSDLVLKPNKTDKVIGNVNPADYTPNSVAKYSVTGNYADLVPKAPVSSATPAAPVAVVGADGKIRYASREEAISKGMTPASAQEGLAPKEIQKREAAYPQATTAVKAIEKSTDSLITDLKALRDHPGLDSITGVAAGRLPAITSNGRVAQAIYDKIVAKGGFQVLQDMREASKTGGALGNVSDKEGSQLKSAFAAIDRKQDASDVRKALDEAISSAQASKARVREQYDMTYDYKNQGKATGAVDTSNPLLK
jgi:hypothetical protein